MLQNLFLTTHNYSLLLDNVLITGGAGFVGTHLVKYLLENSPHCRIVIVDNMNNPSRDFDLENKSTIFYNEDIRNRDAFCEIVKRERVDTCIHLAAIVSVTDSFIRPFETIDVNVKGALSVFEACAKNNVEKIVFASSAAVYGNPEILPIPETHVHQPLSPYGASKASGEALLSSYKSFGKIKNTIALRFFNIYGENQNSAYAGVITKFKERLSKSLPPIIYGTGEQTRDFISVSDVVKAIIRAIEEDVSGVFNIGTGKPLSISELAKKMIKSFNLDIIPIYKNFLQGDIIHSYADVTRSSRTLKFTASETIESPLRSSSVLSRLL